MEHLLWSSIPVPVKYVPGLQGMQSSDEFAPKPVWYVPAGQRVQSPELTMAKPVW